MGRSSGVRITSKLADSATAEADGVLWDAQQIGLGLRVLGSGRKTWVFRYRLARRQYSATLGVYRTSAIGEVRMGVSEARKVARVWRASLDAGNDPKTFVARRGVALTEQWKTFLLHKRERERLSPKTIRMYESHWRAHFENQSYGISHLPTPRISRKDLVRMQRAVADLGRRKADLGLAEARDADRSLEELAKLERRLPTAGNGAANAVMRTASSLFSWLVSSGELDSSPCEKIPTLPTAGRDTAAVLNHADALDAIAVISPLCQQE